MLKFLLDNVAFLHQLFFIMVFSLKPSYIVGLASKHWSVLASACVSLFAIGGYLVYLSDYDYQQLEMVKLMYIHVPSSWMAMMIFGIVGLCGMVSFVYSNVVVKFFAIESAKIGAVFCGLSLFTGSMWGKPIWGTYWVWDARLTSMFVLMLTYISYIGVCNSLKNHPNLDKILAAIALFGLVNLPIIKLSTQYFNTLHQPSSFITSSGIAIDAAFLWPLLIMTLACMTLYLLLVLLAIATSLMENKLEKRKI